MKVMAYEVKDYEINAFQFYAKELNMEIAYSSDTLTMENIDQTKGIAYVTISGMGKITAEILNVLKKNGVEFLAARCIGYNHIDLEAAKKVGIHISNAMYSPNNVADFAVMLMLMLIRKVKVSICRATVNDFSLVGMQGKEMHSLTVGVIGTGRIGATVIQNLSGFGCKILACDKYPSKQISALAKYVDQDTLYRESDIITLHMPLTNDNYHMIDKDSIAKMKDGVIIINTARGGLVNSQDLITALEEEKVGGAGIDTLEDEEGICHMDHNLEIINHRDLLYLKQFPNVILTQHYAFFTDQAVDDMVKSALYSFTYFINGESNPYEVQ